MQPNQQQRMGTSQQNQQRMGTSAAQRMGTGMRNDLLFQGAGGTHQAPIIHRPMTQQGGLGGLKVKQTGAPGQGRQVLTAPYWITLLKQKNNELLLETQSFRKQIDEIQRDNNLFFQLEKRYEELTKEVRNLEGKVADYNLALDKQRTKTRPEDIRNMYEYIKQQNGKHRQYLDEIFIERKNQEEQVHQIENQLIEINQQAELKLNELDPEQRNEYEMLLNENKSLIEEIQAQRYQLDEIGHRLSQMEGKLASDPNKLRAKQYNEELMNLQRKKEDLEFQLDESTLSFPEARDRLLAKIKENNQFITSTDKRIKEVQKMCENYEKRLRDMQRDLEDKKGAEQDKQKYEILYKRDREMTEFIEQFEANRGAQLEQVQKIEAEIISNLEQSSQNLALSGNMPSQEDYKKMQSELGVKMQQTNNAEKTLQMLNVEFETRNQQLQKLDQAEERIEEEITQLNKKLTQYSEEIVSKFDNVWNVKKDFEKRKAQLLKDKDELQKYAQSIQDEVKKVTYEHDIKEKKLSNHENYGLYNDFEKRAAQNEQQVFQLRNYIQVKSQDMNYSDMQGECLGLLSKLNQVLINKK